MSKNLSNNDNVGSDSLFLAVLLPFDLVSSLQLNSVRTLIFVEAF